MTASIITLTDAKGWLQYPNPSEASSDDYALQNVIDAVTDIIEHRVGPCVPKRYTETHCGGDYSIWLRNIPIVDVTEVLENWGPVTYRLDYQDAFTAPIVSIEGIDANQPVATSPWAYSIDNYTTGQVSRRSVANTPVPFVSGEDNIQVSYVAGRQAIPAAIQLAAKEYVAHIWQSAELRGVNLSGQNLQYDAVTGASWSRDDSGDGGMSYWVGIPYRVLALLESEKVKLPCIA